MPFSYTMFLFVCLALLVIIGFTYDSRVRDSYWQQQRSHLTRVSSGMESQLQLMSDYSLQLRTDATLLRLSNMHDETDANYVLAAYRMMQNLTIRQYGLISLPVIRSTLYLKESNHILTSSESVPAELYYRRTRSFRASEYENWLAAMESATVKPTFVDYGQFSGRSGELAVLMDISGAQLPSMPVVVAFELDGSALREYLLPENIADAAVYVLSADGTPLFSVGNAVALSPLTFDANQTAFQGDYRILRRVSPSGRQYLLLLPNSLVKSGDRAVSAHLSADFSRRARGRRAGHHPADSPRHEADSPADDTAWRGGGCERAAAARNRRAAPGHQCIVPAQAVVGTCRVAG
ncbi:MAG: hypothetical protein V8R10_06110 [Christensenellales bacterium]